MALHESLKVSADWLTSLKTWTQIHFDLHLIHCYPILLNCSLSCFNCLKWCSSARLGCVA